MTKATRARRPIDLGVSVDPDLGAPQMRSTTPAAAAPDPTASTALGDSPAGTEGETEPRKGLWHYIGLALSAALLLLVLALAAIVIVIPKLAGGMPLTVLTNSMAPGLPPGTLLVVQPVEFDDIEVGDVITYQITSGDPTVITHRVIGFTSTADGERRLVLQGDNNAEADPDPVREVQVQARLWYSVPLLGWVNTALNGDDRPWIVALVAGTLFAYAAWMVVSAIRDRARKSGKGPTPTRDDAPTA